MSRTTLSRKELYDLAWSKPMIHLANIYGLTDVGLAASGTTSLAPRGATGPKRLSLTSRRRRRSQKVTTSAKLVIVLDDPEHAEVLNPELAESVESAVKAESQSDSDRKGTESLTGRRWGQPMLAEPLSPSAAYRRVFNTGRTRREMRVKMGAWQTEWSFAHMRRVFVRCTLNETINLDSASNAELREFAHTMKNWGLMAL